MRVPKVNFSVFFRNDPLFEGVQGKNLLCDIFQYDVLSFPGIPRLPGYSPPPQLLFSLPVVWELWGILSFLPSIKKSWRSIFLNFLISGSSSSASKMFCHILCAMACTRRYLVQVLSLCKMKAFSDYHSTVPGKKHLGESYTERDWRVAEKWAFTRFAVWVRFCLLKI